jgi:hypothetical protein
MLANLALTNLAQWFLRVAWICRRRLKGVFVLSEADASISKPVQSRNANHNVAPGHPASDILAVIACQPFRACMNLNYKILCD